jgi:uncharacterized protein (DUF302 family)
MTRTIIERVEVPSSLEQVEKKLRAAAASQDLVLAAVHDTTPPTSQYLKGDFRTFEIAYVGPIKEILEVYPDIFSLLPGRICAAEREGRTTLSFIRPSLLAKYASLPAKHKKLVETTCKDFERRLTQLLAELSR